MAADVARAAGNLGEYRGIAASMILRPINEIEEARRAMDFSTVNVELVVKQLLLLLIGREPKIALVPFLEKTKKMDPATQRAVGRQM